MSNELKTSQQSGSTAGAVQATIRRLSDLYIARHDTNVFEANNDSHIAHYGLTLTDRGGDLYSADFPSWITSGTYLITYYTVPGLTLLTSSTILGSETIGWNGSTSTTPSSGEPEVTIGQGVTLLRMAARNAGIEDSDESTYTLEMKHWAIRRALNYFIRETRATWQKDTVAITSGTATIDFSFIPANFHPNRLLKMWIEDQYPVVKGEIEDVVIKRKLNSLTTVPRTIAFQDQFTALCRETPDANYTLNIIWWAPLETFTPGDTSSDASDLVINLPGDMAEYVISTAGVCFLQSNQPQQQSEGALANLWQQFEDYCSKCRDEASWGGVESVKDMTP